MRRLEGVEFRKLHAARLSIIILALVTVFRRQRAGSAHLKFAANHGEALWWADSPQPASGTDQDSEITISKCHF